MMVISDEGLEKCTVTNFLQIWQISASQTGSWKSMQVVVRGSTTSDTSDTIAVNNSRVVGEMRKASERFIMLSNWVGGLVNKTSDYKVILFEVNTGQRSWMRRGKRLLEKIQERKVFGRWRWLLNPCSLVLRRKSILPGLSTVFKRANHHHGVACLPWLKQHPKVTKLPQTYFSLLWCDSSGKHFPFGVRHSGGQVGGFWGFQHYKNVLHPGRLGNTFTFLGKTFNQC